MLEQGAPLNKTGEVRQAQLAEQCPGLCEGSSDLFMPGLETGWVGSRPRGKGQFSAMGQEVGGPIRISLWTQCSRLLHSLDGRQGTVAGKVYRQLADWAGRQPA